MNTAVALWLAGDRAGAGAWQVREPVRWVAEDSRLVAVAAGLVFGFEVARLDTY